MLLKSPWYLLGTSMVPPGYLHGTSGVPPWHLHGTSGVPPGYLRGTLFLAQPPLMLLSFLTTYFVSVKVKTDLVNIPERRIFSNSWNIMHHAEIFYRRSFCRLWRDPRDSGTFVLTSFLHPALPGASGRLCGDRFSASGLCV